jgi:HEAT repeats
MEDEEFQVPDDISDIVAVGDVTIAVGHQDTEEHREWSEAMKRVQLLSDEELFSAVNDPHPGARCEALLRLRARCQADPRTIPAIAGAIGDEDHRVRESAISELRQVLEKRPADERSDGIAAIKQALNDPHEDVRAEARYSLGQLGEML